jgi:hypothetical protein
MKSKLSAALGTVLLAAIIPVAPAIADNVTTHQWFGAAFEGVGSSVFGSSGAMMVNGPLSGGGTGNTINAPATTSFTITMTQPGYLVVTDGFQAGDQFQVETLGRKVMSWKNRFCGAGRSRV